MLKNLSLSLADITGEDYARIVCQNATTLLALSREEAHQLMYGKVDFLDAAMMDRVHQLLPKVAQPCTPTFEKATAGAPTAAYAKAANLAAAPMGGIGYLRFGEDGMPWLVAKSEHYQTTLGHQFGGYRLIDNARRLGILNATHNNTRGYITRLLERELVRTANGIAPGDDDALAGVLAGEAAGVLNRVINLETGSLACEAAFKMMLARFYRLDGTFPAPKYEGKIPVFLVVADNDGGGQANYHGTCILPQTTRGMWPGLYDKCRGAGAWETVPVRINDGADLAAKLEMYNNDTYKTAGFIHEIVLMNYGGILLDKTFLQDAYALCRETDTPTMADEIQSCAWCQGLYLYRQYGLTPDFLILGKGFGGGEYPASKVLTTAAMDNLNQFGALVTNGQEELASLAYLITMRFIEANGDGIDAMGKAVQACLGRAAARYPEMIERVEGFGHLAALHFRAVPQATDFARLMNQRHIDVSVQTYKANCPPAVLFKLPLITDEPLLDYLEARIDEAARQLEAQEAGA